jgi:ATP-binding cassette, subfamily B, bacterial
MSETSHPSALARAWRGVPEFRIGWKGTLGLALVGALGRLVVPLLIRMAIDKGLRADNVRLGYVGALCAAGAVGLAVTSFASRLSIVRLGSTSERGLAVLRGRITSRILGLSLQQHGDLPRGVLVARATSDVETLSEFFSWAAIAWITNAVVMAVVGVAMFLLDWKLALVALIISAVIIPFMAVMQRRLRAAHAEVREHVGSYLGQVAELVSAAPLIRAYRAEAAVSASTVAASERRRRASVRAGAQSAILGVGNQFVEVAIVVTIIVVGLSRTGTSALSAGTLIGFVFLVSRFLEPLGELTEVVDQTQRAIAGIDRILDLLDMPADLAEPTKALTLPAAGLTIDFDAVSFRYPVRRADDPDTESSPSDLHPTFALENLTLHIDAASTVAIVGATGSGKSTLARLIARTLDPTTGTVRIGGLPLTDVASGDLRRRLQLVPQEPFLFDTTIGANVALADPALDAPAIADVFDELGIGDWLRSLPLGLDTEVGERGALLSAGERQLVVLARTRAANPDVLVLDEATSSVDAATEARLAETIVHLASGRTTVVIAHRLTTAARADRVIVMRDGAVVEDGVPGELARKADGEYARLWTAWQRAN